MTILITGIAGFIGSNTAKKLFERGDQIIGLDNFNDYYEPALKEKRISDFLAGHDFKVYRLDLADKAGLLKVFEENKIDKICHLAAQAGVRYSLTNPDVYLESNIIGTNNLLELARQHNIKDFVSLYVGGLIIYGFLKIYGLYKGINIGIRIAFNALPFPDI